MKAGDRRRAEEFLKREQHVWACESRLNELIHELSGAYDESEILAALKMHLLFIKMGSPDKVLLEQVEEEIEKRVKEHAGYRDTRKRER